MMSPLLAEGLKFLILLSTVHICGICGVEWGNSSTTSYDSVSLLLAEKPETKMDDLHVTDVSQS